MDYVIFMTCILRIWEKSHTKLRRTIKKKKKTKLTQVQQFHARRQSLESLRDRWRRNCRRRVDEKHLPLWPARLSSSSVSWPGDTLRALLVTFWKAAAAQQRQRRQRIGAPPRLWGMRCAVSVPPGALAPGVRSARVAHILMELQNQLEIIWIYDAPPSSVPTASFKSPKLKQTSTLSNMRRWTVRIIILAVTHTHYFLFSLTCVFFFNK